MENLIGPFIGVMVFIVIMTIVLVVAPAAFLALCLPCMLTSIIVGVAAGYRLQD